MADGRWQKEELLTFDWLTGRGPGSILVAISVGALMD
jgi:hypothetical protein